MAIARHFVYSHLNQYLELKVCSAQEGSPHLQWAWGPFPNKFLRNYQIVKYLKIQNLDENTLVYQAKHDQSLYIYARHT